MIYITGDIHGDPFSRLSVDAFPEQKQMGKEDFVIICGDFGCVWGASENPTERYKLNWLDDRPFTTLFVDGNHENHDRLDSLPISEWHGADAHLLRPSVIHLMRGRLYRDVCGKSIFAFGGARSHDIWNLLDPENPAFRDKRASLWLKGEFFRVKGESWWEREMPSDKEKRFGLETLASAANRVDFIVTHEAPESVFEKIYAGKKENDPLRSYLEELHESVEYGAWFFGHYHDNAKCGEKDYLLYDQIVRAC